MSPGAEAGQGVDLIRLHPGVARGSLRVPSSKSYTHRALLGALLSPRPVMIQNPLDSEDTRVSLKMVEGLGGKVDTVELPGRTAWRVEPPPVVAERPCELDAGESGTSIRLFTCAAALGKSEVTFRGSDSLARRPMVGLLRALQDLGAKVHAPPSGRSLPFTIRGPIQSGCVNIETSETSQYLTGLLMTLPTLREPSEVRVTGPVVSRPYIEATLAYLKHERIEVRTSDEGYVVPGRQQFAGLGFEVPGDASSAAYLLTLAVTTRGDVTLTGIDAQWPQADLAILGVLSEVATPCIQGKEGGLRMSGADLTRIKPFDWDLDDNPDLGPLLAVLATFANGTSHLTGGGHLVSKESDRRRGMATLVRALGGQLTESPSRFEIEGPPEANSLRLDNLSDHRMFMSAAVAAAGLPGPSILGPAGAAAKSYPGFLNDLKLLGIRSEPVSPENGRMGR